MENINLDIFEKNNLIIESDRVLVYSKIFCPLGCKYCFVEDLNKEEDRQNFYLSSNQLELLKKLPENIHTIMLGCDTEFFQDEKEAIKILKDVSVLGKDISIIIKLKLSDDIIKTIKEISDSMQLNNNILSFSISIPCFESSNLWEPNAPSVKERVETLKKVSEAGIPSMVAIRPLIPNISENEIDQIIQTTHSYVLGYYSGPLYLKDLDSGILTNKDIENSDLLISKTEPNWMPKGNIFLKIENPRIMLYLKGVIEKYNIILFEGAAQGTDFIKNNKK